MSTKPNKKNNESELLQEQIIKLEKQLESFKHSNDHFLKNKLFLHYDIKEPEKVVVDCETKLPILAEVDKKKIQNGKESDPTHLLLEGDNYHALSVLNYTHVGKIDIIYIDPPYNTGNKDFIYNDRFVDREDAFRHSKWLSFMAHRLRLAKNLLAETGVIFISIDDNEQAHLRLLCDQIFGEENFVETIMVEMSNTGGMKVGAAKEGKIAKNGEYVLVYSRSTEGFSQIERTPLYDFVSGFDTHFNLWKNDDGKIRKFSEVLAENEKVVKEFRHYKIEPKNNSISLKKLSDYFDKSEVLQKFVLDNLDKITRPRTEVPNIPDETSRKLRQNKWIEYKSKKRNEPYYITKDDAGNIIQLVPIAYNYRNTDDFEPKYGRSVIRGDFWKGFWLDMGNISKEGGVDFKNGKKPIRLIVQLLKWAVSKDKSATILDFFAGSGTTGHAVLKLNAQDSGTRQFILCTNNENKIAENVTYPRIKKVIDGYGDNAPSPANLRYFQTDFVEKKGSASQLKIDLTRQCAEMLCVKENVFEAVKLKKQAKNYKFFKNGDKYLGVFFDFFTDAEFAGFIKELNALPKEAEKAVYVFVLDGSAGILADEFAGVANCEVKEIPQKILDIYKQLAREVARK